MSQPTLLDIAKMNGSDGVAGLIDEASTTHPEITRVPARTIRGLNYRTLVRTANPTVGFRNANEGAAATKGTYENRLVETYILNPRWQCDKAVADRHEDGAEAFIALEAGGIMDASMYLLSQQFYYGTTQDAKGFPGLLAALDTSNMEIDAEGTTGSAGSSVWAVRFGPKDVTWVWGNDGELELDDLRVESVADDDSNLYDAYIQTMLAYPGLQVGSTESIGRIKRLTAQTGKTLTDSLIADLLATFPAGKLPDVLFMTRRSVRQLQGSRTATNATGAPAPIPAEAFGIPIEITDALTDTEATS